MKYSLSNAKPFVAIAFESLAYIIRIAFLITSGEYDKWEWTFYALEYFFT